MLFGSDHRMQKVIHLIPYDGIGGVETAARSMAQADAVDLDFRVETIFFSYEATKGMGIFNPISFLSTFIRLRRAASDE